MASLSELLKLWLTVDTAESGVLVILKAGICNSDHALFSEWQS